MNTGCCNKGFSFIMGKDEFRQFVTREQKKSTNFREEVRNGTAEHHSYKG